MNAVNVWTTPNGRTVEIPADLYAQVRFTKDGIPDKRSKNNAAFWEWADKQDAACPECGQVEGHYDDCPVGLGATVAAFIAAKGIVSPTSTPLMDGAVFTQRQAQAYANRVWAGQSPDVKRAERIERVKRALAGQNLPFEGVVLP